MAQSVKNMPLAQVMISGSLDRALHWGSLLSRESASSSPSVRSLSLSQTNIKILKKKKTKLEHSVCLLLRDVAASRDLVYRVKNYMGI